MVGVVTTLCAVGVPVGLARAVAERTRAVSARLSEVAGVASRIGDIDADLTGALRLSSVSVGELFAADQVEASVALDSMLSGSFSADEVRVARPRISVDVDRHGDSNLAQIVRRFGERRPRGARSGAGRGARVRRIVVSSGALTARVADLGELSADKVEIVPDGEGVRIITGPLQVRGGAGRVRGTLTFTRSAAEVSLPHVRFGRVLAVAGAGVVEIGEQALQLDQLGVGRLSSRGTLEARGFVHDHGVLRAVGVDLVPPSARPGEHPGYALTVRGDRIPLAPFAAILPAWLAVAGARVSGSVEVSRDARALRLDVDGSVHGLKLDHPTLSPQPVPMDAQVSGAVAVSHDAVSLERARVTVGAARWSAAGWLRRVAPAAGQIDLQLAEAPCMELLGSLPAEIRGVLDGIAMTGTFGGRARLDVDLAAPDGDGVALDTSFANQCVVTSEPPGADVTRLTTASEHVFPDGTRAVLVPGQPPYVTLQSLPWYVSGAFVSAEDTRFHLHRGFDLKQIARSLEIDLRDGRLARGGSTISQQLVKNAFLTQRRSFDRKVQEAILTWRLESRVDKRTILERYLNVIELGPGIFGLRAAAAYWFGTVPSQLTIRQAAFLAALTSEPTSMGRRIRKFGGIDPTSAARTDVILRAMTRDGVLSRGWLQAAREMMLRFTPGALRRDG